MRDIDGGRLRAARRIYDRPRSCWRWCAVWPPNSSAKLESPSNRLNVAPPRASDKLGQWLAPARRGRIGLLSVLGIVATLCLFIGFFVGAHVRHENIARSVQLSPVQAENRGERVSFILPLLDATDVSVVGSFNDWEPITLSDADENGIWRVDIFLTPGRYEYAFIIDGRWWGHDPLADEYVRSFGEYSSVRYIRGSDGA
jgi:hypothetical protein